MFNLAIDSKLRGCDDMYIEVGTPICAAVRTQIFWRRQAEE
jgi:hypothetical protein